MHLAIDSVGIKHRGGATVLLDVLSAAIANPGFGRITLFCCPRSSRIFDLPRCDRLTEFELPSAERSYADQVAWFEARLGHRCQQIGVDALLCLGGVGASPEGIPHATFVQNALPFSAEGMSVLPLGLKVRMLGLRLLMSRSCRSSQRVIVQTPTMKDWVCDAFGIPRQKVESFLPVPRILPRTDDVPAVLEVVRRTRADARFLYVGNTSPYKNLRTVAMAMRTVRSTVRGTTLFVTCGTEDPLCGYEGICAIGYMGPGPLRHAYELATLLVMPSLVETAALPVLEAMSMGTPVLAADRPYAHDLCEDAAEFFDPSSPQDFATKAIALLRDEARRKELSSRGLSLSKRRSLDRPYERIADLMLRVARGSSQRSA